MTDVLPKYSKVVCPRKRHLIGVTNIEIPAGRPIVVSKIDFEPGQERIAGEPPKCKICDSAYIVQNKVFTSNGWQPSDPKLEPVSPR